MISSKNDRVPSKIKMTGATKTASHRIWRETKHQVCVCVWRKPNFSVGLFFFLRFLSFASEECHRKKRRRRPKLGKHAKHEREQNSVRNPSTPSPPPPAQPRRRRWWRNRRQGPFFVSRSCPFFCLFLTGARNRSAGSFRVSFDASEPLQTARQKPTDSKTNRWRVRVFFFFIFLKQRFRFESKGIRAAMRPTEWNEAHKGRSPRPPTVRKNRVTV